ncbi:MAG: fumarylacetoacetate hydrolase family protein [Acidimicrobiia bacterium]|nr:fumarylacetoacetate hydrolase family protein [Acidimicrobiia bacterium]
MLTPSAVISAEDSFRTQARPRRTGLALQRPAGLEAFRRPDPSEDVWFVPRDPASLADPARGVICPTGCRYLDAGVTLALIIGADGTSVAEVAIALDVVRRDVPDAQACLARSFPTHTPIGVPVARTSIADLRALHLTFTVDGERRQDASIADMVVDPEVLVASIARRVPLGPGDVILTGSPPGLALDRGDGWLMPGNRLVAEVPGIGVLETMVVPETGSTLPLSPALPGELTVGSGRVFVTGTNFRSHVDEMGSSVPPVPTANLMKLPHALCASDDEITLPPAAFVDYEGEIAIVIGTNARSVDPADAERVIAGLCLANDVSSRDAPTTHLLLAKNGRGFGPLGPIVPVERLDLDNVSFTVSVNGETRQLADTRDMVHSIREIVASYSAALPLRAGDVILTGSPSGVGAARHPPVFLGDGDTVVVESPELGTLSNRFVASPPAIADPSGTEAA